ncbi:MAG: hypothetical protein ACOCRX_06315 [Candidatus Woesearchaeota archaeon]
MSDDRQVQILKNGEWENIDFENVELGDIIRFIEPNGDIVKNAFGNQEFQAVSEPFNREEDGVLTINCMSIKMYQSREYCKESNCTIQKILDDEEETIELKCDLKKNVCRNQCKAYDYHQYLKENGYEIIKKED